MEAFQTTETQLRQNELDKVLAKYRNWRVPQDKLRDVLNQKTAGSGGDANHQDETTEIEELFDDLGDLPVLMIDLVEVVAEEND